jgi:hypothetical protein
MADTRSELSKFIFALGIFVMLIGLVVVWWFFVGESPRQIPGLIVGAVLSMVGIGAMLINRRTA